MKHYIVSMHAAERFMERFKGSINVFEAQRKLQLAVRNCVVMKRKSSRSYISYLLNTDLGAIFVVNNRSNVVITVTKVRRPT